MDEDTRRLTEITRIFEVLGLPIGTEPPDVGAPREPAPPTVPPLFAIDLSSNTDFPVSASAQLA